VAVIPILISLLLFILSRIEYVRVSSGKIEFSKYTLQYSRAIILGFKTIESIERDVTEVINVSIIKKGV